MPDVEDRITVRNLTYTVRGFNAIADLKKWLDENAECRGSDECLAEPISLPPADVEYPTAVTDGNSGVPS